jgi:cytochrome c oxidase assembly protein subunit 15
VPADRQVLQATVSSWIFIGLLQGAIGYIQYFNGVPELLVGLHVAGATTLWSMTVWLVLSTSKAVPVVTRDGRVAVTGLVPSRST